jgi:hypothetical protein
VSGALRSFLALSLLLAVDRPWRFQRHASSGAYSVEFENGGFTCVVYDQDNGSEAASGSGVAVRNGSKSVASLACAGDAVLEIASLKRIVRTAPDSQEEP